MPGPAGSMILSQSGGLLNNSSTSQSNVAPCQVACISSRLLSMKKTARSCLSASVGCTARGLQSQAGHSHTLSKPLDYCRVNTRKMLCSCSCCCGGYPTSQVSARLRSSYVVLYVHTCKVHALARQAAAYLRLRLILKHGFRCASLTALPNLEHPEPDSQLSHLYVLSIVSVSLQPKLSAPASPVWNLHTIS
jgi:hypothetical protein